MSIEPKTLIIAEAGVNHNGSLELAIELVDVAVAAGADIVKFQTFSAEKLVVADAKMADYQKINMNSDCSQFEMLKDIELSKDKLIYIRDYCNEKNIEFLSTAFDIEAQSLLVELGCKRIKVASGELTNKPFLKDLVRYQLPVLLSTGMADLNEVEWAVQTLIREGLDKNKVSILHCTTNYPAQFNQLNLLAIKTLKDHFDVPVGYSDHSLGFEAAIVAVSLGAFAIEKHITTDKDLPGPDHAASMTPDEFCSFVTHIRNTETSLGDGIKTPHTVELKNRLVTRKSLVAQKPIQKNELLSLENITTKRPGTGISAQFIDELIGKKSNRNYKINELIDIECLD